MKCIFYTLIQLTFIQLHVFGQNTDEFSLNYNFFKDPLLKGKIDYVIGYEGIKNGGIELGISKGYRGYEGWTYVYSSYQLTTEFFTTNSTLIISPKIGYSKAIAFLHLGAYAIYYIDTKTGNTCFFTRSEIGPTVLGIATNFYGYNAGPTYSDTINNIVSEQELHLVKVL